MFIANSQDVKVLCFQEKNKELSKNNFYNDIHVRLMPKSKMSSCGAQ